MNSQSFTEVLSAAFVWTWKTSAHGAVLIALMWLVQLAFKRALAPRWRYALGLVVVVRLVLPFTPSSSLSIFNLAAFQHREIRVRLSPAKIQPPAQKLLFTPQPTPAATPTQPVAKKPLLLILPTTWLTGCIALIALALRQHLNLARQLRGLKPVDEPKIRSVLGECKNALRIRRKINVLATDALDTPALFGIFRPRLLVPTEMLEQLDERELRLVFLHELTHLKRGDVLVNWAVILLRSVHWFNPLVWLAFKKLRADQELACDAAVMSLLGEPERRLYGDTLIKLAAEFPAAPVCPGFVPFITKQKLIKKRITMIARYKPASKVAPALYLIMIAALGIATFTRASDQPTMPATTHHNNDNNNAPPETAPKTDAKRTEATNQVGIAHKHQLDNARTKYMRDSRRHEELNKFSPDDFREAYDLDKQGVAAKLDQPKRTRDTHQTDVDRMEIDAKMRSGENIGR